MQQSPSVSEGLLSPDEMLSTDDYFGRRRSTSASGHSAHSNDHGACLDRYAVFGPALNVIAQFGTASSSDCLAETATSNCCCFSQVVRFGCLDLLRSIARASPHTTGSGRSRTASGARAGAPGSGSAGSKSSAAAPEPAAERLSGLMARAADLLLVLSHADSTVKVSVRALVSDPMCHALCRFCMGRQKHGMHLNMCLIHGLPVIGCHAGGNSTCA